MFRRRSSSENDARILIANSLVDIDPDYAVSASDLPNRGTGGSGYDLDTNVGTAANRKIHPSGSCLLFGASGDYASTPDAAGNSITGDIDIRARVAPDDWTPASENTAVAKWSSGQNSFTFGISSTSGRLVVNLSPVAAGTGAIQVLSSAGTGFTDGELGWIRMTWSNSSDVMNFYSSTDDTDDDTAVNWTQLGTANVSAVLAGIADTTANISIGAYNGGASSRFNGTIRKVAIYNGIDGTLAVDFDPTNYVSGTTFNTTMSDELVTNGGFDADSDWTKGSGWTISGGAASFDGVGTDTISQNLGLVTGVTYLVSYDITAISGSVYVVLGGDSAGTVRSSTGSYTDVVVSGTNAIFYVQPQTGTCTIDNISIIKITPWTLNGNSFIQNTGHDVLHSIGSNGLETSAGQTINAPLTAFWVGRISNTPSADVVLMDARSSASDRCIFQTDDSNSDFFTMFEGLGLVSSGLFTNNPVVITGQFNANTQSKITANGSSGTGNAGSGDWDFGTVLANNAGTQSMQGYLARLLVFDYALSETQVSAIQSYLSAYYSL